MPAPKLSSPWGEVDIHGGKELLLLPISLLSTILRISQARVSGENAARWQPTSVQCLIPRVSSSVSRMAFPRGKSARLR